MSQLGWSHHTLVQALLSRGPLPEKEVHSIFYGVTGKNPGTHQHLFNDFLLKINKELAHVQFELRGCRNQYDGEVYYGVVNNVADEQSKLGTKYSVPQIAFYKGIVETIMQDESAQGCITNFVALNIRLEDQVQTNQSTQESQSQVPSAIKNFSMTQKSKTISDLIHDGWLCTTSDGKVGLGIRTFLDLRNWFRSNSVPACEVCLEAGVKADMCSKEDCPIRMHSYCLQQKFKKKGLRVCPGCGTLWEVREQEWDLNEDPEPVPTQQAPSVPTQQAPSVHEPAPSQHFHAVRAPRTKRSRICKSEAVELAQSQTDTEMQTQTQSQPDDPSKGRRLRSCKAEAAYVSEVVDPPEAAANGVRRSRRSSIRKQW